MADAHPIPSDPAPRPGAGDLLLLVGGVFACSTAVLLIKASSVHPVLLSGYRLLFAALILSPLAWRAARRQRPTAALLRRSFAPAVALALHFITWAIGARGTDAANASLLVNLTPLVMPLFLAIGAHERVSRRELLGTVIAFGGVALLTAGDFAVRPHQVAGDLMCLLSMLLFTAYLALGRRNRDLPDLWLYLVPLYGIAGLLCFALAPLWTDPFAALPAREYLLLLGLAVIPTVAGHSLLNRSLKHLRGQIVTIVNLGQFVFAAVLAALLFRELPQPLFYPAAALVAIGAWIAIRPRG